ncbi:PaaX family transcriptional regulator [Blastococcus xanthinilyticus]|uniref:PaaX family transcriptional regulator n=1 Tax=Blastococcus xanthinilyticus TaxID=1564164 RepID=A0A5S5D6Q2_9ACTN|nr:PaaX family transcriptional regulator C-terminal domain-containing protein [Blastococcus xanthinilyticus]TYP90319.1 PaaX family transcriptional regulator [Blastococcus xanthinilyticus]
MTAVDDLAAGGRGGGPDGAGADPEGAGPHRPQALVFSFFGGVVLRREDAPPIPSSVFLRVLDGLGVAEAAARATLARMTRKGLLERTQVGRAAYYRLSPETSALVERAGVRVASATPFEHPDETWTLLSYSMPESRRDLRHRVRAALTWAGFGGLRDGVWIAPGTVDVAEVFAEGGLEEVTELAEWFAATPLPGVRVDELIRRAWSVDRIRERHDQFIAAWWAGPHEGDPLGQITRLGADWLQLLRTDPGLPARHLSADWPAAQSTAVYRRCYEALLPAAARGLDDELGRAVAG